MQSFITIFFIEIELLYGGALRDVDSTPLSSETGNGDDYRAKYLDWYNLPYAEYVQVVTTAYETLRHQEHSFEKSF